MKQLSVISVTVLAMLLLSTSAMAWSGYGAKRCNMDCNQARQGNHVERMGVILDLSAEQQQQMEELRTNHQQKRAQMRSKLRDARQQMRTAQPGTSVDVEELKAKARTYADLKAAMLVDKIEHKQQMFDILTPEQQEKAAKLADVQCACLNCIGCDGNGDGCYAANTDCAPGNCPKNVTKGKGCCPQGQNACMNCAKMKRCR
jgi:Spy/CpxP family protein refolding chaperone